MTENTRLMTDARNALEGRWGIAIGTFILYQILMGMVQMVPVIGFLGTLVIGGPMAIGLSIFSLRLAREQEAKVEQIFDGFKKFEKGLAAYLLMVVYVFLWMLLFIIPGIIKAISYSQTFFILADNDDIESSEALKMSEEMMDGYKWKYFFMGLRFLGWGILCIFTLGIGFLWLIPYMQVSYANFYDDVQGNDIKGGGMVDDDILDSDLV